MPAQPRSEEMPQEIVFATSNPHKLEEARPIVAVLGITLLSLDECGVQLPEPVEDAATFAANAEIKARYYATALNRSCLAEDSGLVVDALDGAPGVLSARYAEAEGERALRDQANNHRLLREMQAIAPGKRQARFVCSLCLVEPQVGVLARAEGFFEGVVAQEQQGGGGFGYDSLLYLPELSCTSAQLSPAQKNARSHRGSALRQLVAILRATPTGSKPS